MSVFVVGSLHLDVVLNAPHLPGLDETVTGHDVAYVFGGKGGNQALAAAKMGAEVAFAGRVGADGFGATLRETLTASGIDITQLQHDPGPSGMSAAIVDAQGGYGAVIVSAANLNIAAEEIVLPPQTRIVLLQNEIPEAVNLAVAQQARAMGAQVWLNAAPAREVSAALMDALDLLIVNRVEAAFYAGKTDGTDTLTTLGADGVLYRGKAHAGVPVEVVSTHGAGDMFVGALAAKVARGTSLVDALPFAQAAAALHVASDLQARAGLTHAAVTAFLIDHTSR
ncbi:PfkB family carbohydrate kinase [Primorskyibacter sp. S187A]|uniref:PfkB family carbohydrate kinase n=1 Tax=Primorskyibacter sp. S187A TaxID=3415130 RepID=UPI003C7BF1F4